MTGTEGKNFVKGLNPMLKSGNRLVLQDIMTALPLIFLGAPVLRMRAEPISDPVSPEIATLAASMAATMTANHGVGLAAPQVGLNQRLIVFCVPESRAEDQNALPLQVLINPEFTPLTETQVEGLEGCLSLPGLRGMVPRWQRIGYRGLGLDGKLVEREAEGFHARVVQHEIDHLDGVMYPDRMRDFSTLVHECVIRRQLQQAAEERHAQEQTAQEQAIENEAKADGASES